MTKQACLCGLIWIERKTQMLAHEEQFWLYWPLAPWQRVPFVAAQSPYESSADFAKYAMKLREQALLKVEPQVFVPTTSRTTSPFPWKTNIVTTVFWIGEKPTANNPVAESQKLLGLPTGRAITAVTTIPIPRGGATTSRSPSSRGRIHFTAPCLITMSRTGSSSRKRRW